MLAQPLAPMLLDLVAAIYCCVHITPKLSKLKQQIVIVTISCQSGWVSMGLSQGLLWGCGQDFGQKLWSSDGLTGADTSAPKVGHWQSVVRILQFLTVYGEKASVSYHKGLSTGLPKCTHNITTCQLPSPEWGIIEKKQRRKYDVLYDLASEVTFCTFISSIFCFLETNH